MIYLPFFAVGAIAGWLYLAEHYALAGVLLAFALAMIGLISVVNRCSWFDCAVPPDSPNHARANTPKRGEP